MSQDVLKKRVYKITETCRGAIKRLKLEGHEELTFSAKLTRRGEKLNGVTRAATDHFSQLLRESIRSEDPDRVFVQFYDEHGTELWAKSFALEVETSVLNGPTALQPRGLGEAEVNHLVEVRMQELRREEELTDLRKACDTLEKENEALQKQLSEAEDVLEAKKNVEYYSNIIGLALPGLAKMLGRSPLGATLGMLAGAEVEPPAEAAGTGQEARGQRDAIIDLVLEFMRSLPDEQLGSLYLVFVELSNNPNLITEVLATVTARPPSNSVPTEPPTS